MQAKREELARQRHDLQARELEVERRTRDFTLNAVRDAEAVAPLTQPPTYSETGTLETQTC